MRNALFIRVAIVLLLAGCGHAPPNPTHTQANPSSGPSSIETGSNVNDQEQQLLRLATDVTRPEFERKRAFFEFFDRYVNVGDKLRDLLEKSNRFDWLPDDSVLRLSGATGPIPIAFGRGTIIVIRPLLGDYSTIYLRIDSQISQRQFNDILISEKNFGEIGDTRILEIVIWMAPDHNNDQIEINRPHKP